MSFVSKVWIWYRGFFSWYCGFSMILGTGSYLKFEFDLARFIVSEKKHTIMRRLTCFENVILWFCYAGFWRSLNATFVLRSIWLGKGGTSDICASWWVRFYKFFCCLCYRFSLSELRSIILLEYHGVLTVWKKL